VVEDEKTGSRWRSAHAIASPPSGGVRLAASHTRVSRSADRASKRPYLLSRLTLRRYRLRASAGDHGLRCPYWNDLEGGEGDSGHHFQDKTRLRGLYDD
jgi:hypothetical protein